jgi:acetate kinase
MNRRNTILCLNSGSSSLKFSLYQMEDDSEKLLMQGAVERIGLADGRLRVQGGENQVSIDAAAEFPDHDAAFKATLGVARERLKLPRPDGVGHRVVHGGSKFTAAQRVDEKLLEALRSLVAFAPLHMPSAIRIIETVTAAVPELPQVACFDTAFHRSMPELAQRFPLAGTFWDQGLRRYGFHGLSYEYILDTLPAVRQGRTVIAHLGNGASLAAVRDGRPLDTTMGFTPAAGFMMGTRSGDLDPGLLIHLLTEKGYDGGRLDHLVNHEAGLLGVSGISSDMKTLLEMRASNPRAALAVDMFCYQVRKQIGALAAVLGGLDTLVFTGGMGERGTAVRREICQGLEFLGIEMDSQKNDAHADIISTPHARCVTRVIPTREDLMIARHTRKVLFSFKHEPATR